MADLTLQQRFGSNSHITEQDGNYYLQIKLADLQDSANGGDFTNGLGLDLSGMTPSNAEEYGSKIFWALMLACSTESA